MPTIMKKILYLICTNLLLVLMTACGTTASNQSLQKIGETPSAPLSGSVSDAAPSKPIETAPVKVASVTPTKPAPKVIKPDFKFNSFDGSRTVSVEPERMDSYHSFVCPPLGDGKAPEFRWMNIGAKWNSASNLKDFVTLVVRVYSSENYYTLKDAKLNIDGVMLDTVPSRTVTDISRMPLEDSTDLWYTSTKEFLVPRDVLARIVASGCTQIRILTLSGNLDDIVNRPGGNEDAINALKALFKIIE